MVDRKSITSKYSYRKDGVILIFLLTILLMLLQRSPVFAFTFDNSFQWKTSQADITFNLGASTTTLNPISWTDTTSVTFGTLYVRFLTDSPIRPTLLFREVSQGSKVKFEVTGDAGSVTNTTVSVDRRPSSVAITLAGVASSVLSSTFYTSQTDFDAFNGNAAFWVESTKRITVKVVHSSTAVVEVIVPAAQSGGPAGIPIALPPMSLELPADDDSGDFQRVDYYVDGNLVTVYLLPSQTKTQTGTPYKITLYANAKLASQGELLWSESELSLSQTKSITFNVDMTQAPNLRVKVHRGTASPPATIPATIEDVIPAASILSWFNFSLSTTEGRVEFFGRVFTGIFVLGIVSFWVRQKRRSPALTRSGKRFVKSLNIDMGNVQKRFRGATKRRD